MRHKLSNPFFHRGLIQSPEYFIGRKNILDGLLGMVLNNQSCSIVGPRKIGKSSLLYCLLRNLRSRGEDIVCPYIDSQRLVDTPKSQLWMTLLRAVYVQSGQKPMPERSRLVWERILQHPEDKIDVQDVAQVFEVLREQGTSVVFLFDEFESLIDNMQLGPIFFSEFRSIIGGEFNTCVVTVSQRGLFELTYSEDLKASPFFNIFNDQRVNLFNPDETAQLLNAMPGMADAPFAFDPTDCELIRELAGNHPFFLQLAAYNLFEEKARMAEASAKVDTELVRENFRANAKSHFRYIWQSLTVPEKEAIQRIANNVTTDLPDDLSSSLHKKAVIVPSAPPGIFSRAFCEFAKQQKPAAQVTHITEIGVTDQYDLEIHYGRDILSVRLEGGEFALIHEGRYLHEDIQSYNIRIQDTALSPIWHRKSGYVGTALFRDIVTNIPAIAKSYWYARGLVGATPQALKITFVGDREFVGLPLEFLKAEGEWLALQHPIRRRISGLTRARMPICPEFIKQLRLKGETLKILLVASNTLPNIPGVDTEIATLQKLIPELASQIGMEIQLCCVQSEDASLESIHKLLDKCQFHILHYAGHGDYDENRPDESGIFFWQGPGKTGRIARVKAVELRNWLQGSITRFTYFSCCYASSTGATSWLNDGDFLGILDSAIKSGVPAAVGFRWPASDRGSIDLAASFYRHLFSSFSIEKALFQAKCDAADININDTTWASAIAVIQ